MESDQCCDQLYWLADAFVTLIRAGERNQTERFAAQHPELANEIRDLFPMLESLELAALGVFDDESHRTIRPQRLGEFSVLREIGRGGMGVVYEAIHEPLSRRVALKVIPKNSLASVQVDRFRREATATASLHHTCIVPVFAFGETDEWCYFAMQLIAGQSLAELMLHWQCQDDCQNPASTESQGRCGLRNSVESSRQRQIASIGIQVANAVAHAHRHGILHRDLKPSNILVDARANAWVTDFGLAQLIGADQLTGSNDLVGTLRYMAPERFCGVSDERCDVFGVGVTLYELLSLQPAHTIRDRPALVRAIMDAPLRPLRERIGNVSRDLETVVMKAVAHDPKLRYQSADALAEDLRRFLVDEPILARKHSGWENAWRWARRKPGMALLACVAVVSLWIAVSVLLVSNHRVRRERDAKIAALASSLRNEEQATLFAADARENYRLAKNAVEETLEEIRNSSELNSIGALQPLRKQLLAKVIPFYDALAKRRGNDVSMEVERGLAYMKLSMLCSEIGESGPALRRSEEAQAIFEGLVESEPDNSVYQLILMDCYKNLGKTLASVGRPEEALKATCQAIHLLQRLESSFADSRDYRQESGRLQYNRAWLLLSLGRTDDAKIAFQQMMETLERQLRDQSLSENSFEYSLLANVYTQLGRAQSDSGDTNSAMKLFENAVNVHEALVALYPNQPEREFELAATHNNIGLVASAQDQFGTASLHLTQAESTLRSLIQRFPEMSEYRQNLAATQLNLAELYGAHRQWHLALPLIHAAIANAQHLVEDSPENPGSLLIQAAAYRILARTYYQTGQFEYAEMARGSAEYGLAELSARFPDLPELLHEQSLMSKEQFHFE
ncbi:MAG: protein kinase [Pirellulaceae bacterium]